MISQGSDRALMTLFGAFCNTFDPHKAIISLETQFLVFMRVAVLHRFYCSYELLPSGLIFKA